MKIKNNSNDKITEDYRISSFQGPICHVRYAKDSTFAVK